MKRYIVMLLCGVLSTATAGSLLTVSGGQTALAQEVQTDKNEQTHEQTQETAGNDESQADIDEAEHAQESDSEAPVFPGLTWDHALPLSYADQFSVDYYEGGYKLFTIEGDGEFLLVPDGEEAPEDLPDDITVLSHTPKSIYLVATSAMDFFCGLDALDHISLSGTNADGWYIDKAKTALEDGSIAFAGKYSAPDYEQILAAGCDLAIESTMIYHKPEVKEKLEELGIPVLVEHSSYESHPLGRTEWVKLYGALLGKEDEAEALFEEQASQLKSLENTENTGKTVAFFYINSMGSANVRKSNDYVSKMIELAGGKYIFNDLGTDEEGLSTMNMGMEDFYAGAKDADYIIYNSTIDGELGSLDELLKKSTLLKDFKAVKEGNVWCLTKSMFQETTCLGDVIMDIHRMLTEDDPDGLTYLYRLE